MHGHWRFLLLVIAGLGGCAAPPSDFPQEGTTISSVSIGYVGAHTVDEVRLQTYIGSKKGTPYRSEQVDNDIKSLYESGLVNDVRVLAEPEKNGVGVIFEVQTRAGSGPTLFAGNTVFSDQRLAKETGLRVGRKIDAPTLRSAAKRIEAYYHAHGYPGTKVSVRTESADFIFIVEEGLVPEKRDRD